MHIKNGDLYVKKLQKRFVMNKNISVWRGSLAPPTHFHLWVVNDSTIKIYRNGNWVDLYDEATPVRSGLMSASDKQILDDLNENLHWN